jgi:hypothetical protein
MKTKIPSTIAVVAMMWGAGAARDSPAQTRWSETPVEHASPGGPSDGAFHHRFEDAEKWAKEFDNPERDAWQKPEEILDALHLQRTSLVADIGAGTGYFSVGLLLQIRPLGPAPHPGDLEIRAQAVHHRRHRRGQSLSGHSHRVLQARRGSLISSFENAGLVGSSRQ